MGGVADTESEATYHELFRSLEAAGASGIRGSPDDHEGLKAAVARAFSGSILAKMPGPLRSQSPRDGGPH